MFSVTNAFGFRGTNADCMSRAYKKGLSTPKGVEKPIDELARQREVHADQRISSHWLGQDLFY
ncbi:hypothetical protein [Pseudochrobactrum sp. B5]|uniref:hypothetical protein n=1 Tax=Pseudochrobactrum sp. B5 TaxID=1289478 RepID=UPI000950C864|nr:hypothetical protein [Pseudochrobactrum sp. B5]